MVRGGNANGPPLGKDEPLAPEQRRGRAESGPGGRSARMNV
jgi:hypothetical protein